MSKATDCSDQNSSVRLRLHYWTLVIVIAFMPVCLLVVHPQQVIILYQQNINLLRLTHSLYSQICMIYSISYFMSVQWDLCNYCAHLNHITHKQEVPHIPSPPNYLWNSPLLQITQMPSMLQMYCDMICATQQHQAIWISVIPRSNRKIVTEIRPSRQTMDKALICLS